MGWLVSLWRFFVPRERTLLFMTFSVDDYSKVKHKLVMNGIPHRTRVGNFAGERSGYQTRRSEYSIYVAYEDEAAAVKALNSK
ncbi:hypothetical protein P9847_21560 [Paenibacillus chibensis]|uniref:DUF2007 domain-containing protein n=1 Tax=Paenibacillus chibensis TaxID=59846 RepID=A0ABU6PYD4_9BACL|nr:hypothetical protein [Paenibacillus chibensis]MEC0369321.1 hypothetical protein [Paenibacillus chibensis]MED5019869.1 hypothetical protein [Paenibacillus chibensis]